MGSVSKNPNLKHDQKLKQHKKITSHNDIAIYNLFFDKHFETKLHLYEWISPVL